MWREQFDYYWDGRRRLAIGWFEGAERAAVRPELTVAADRSVAVPLAAGVESLNVAVAAGILLYEVARDS